MVLFINKVTQFNVHVSVQQMREQIKIYAYASQIFQEDIIDFLPRMLHNLNKIIKEEANNRLNTAIAETIGEIVQFIIGNIESYKE